MPGRFYRRSKGVSTVPLTGRPAAFPYSDALAGGLNRGSPKQGALSGILRFGLKNEMIQTILQRRSKNRRTETMICAEKIGF